MFWQLLKFELNYQSRQVSWWFALFMLTALGYFLSGRQVYHANVMALSAQNLTYAMMFICQIALFTTSLISANAALRDYQYDFHAFVQTKPVSNTVITFSRFVSLFVMSFMLILSAVAAILLPFLLTDYNTEIYGVFELSNILWPLIVIALPCIFFISSILYVSASLSKSSVMTFVAGVGIYVFYMISAAFLDSPMFLASSPLARGEINLASLLDPFAIAAFKEQTHLLTAQELNKHFVVLEGNFLYNRLVWLIVSVLLLACVVKTSKYKGDKQKKKTKRKARHNLASVDMQSLKYQPVMPCFNAWLAFKANVLLELKMILKGKSFSLLLLLVIGLVLAQLVNGLNNNFFVGEQLPFTSIMLRYVSNPLEMVGVFIVIFFTGELVWRGREQEFDSVLNVTPTGKYIHFFAQIVVMASVIALVISVLILIVIIYQLLDGFYADDIGLMFSLFPLVGLPLLLMAVLSLSIQSMVNNKYVGFILVAAIFLFYKSDIASQLGINHHLLRFTEAGPILFSDFSGFDFFLKSTFWFSLYWILVTTLIAIFAYGVSKRSIGESTFIAFKRINTLLGAKGQISATIVSIFIAACSIFIFYNTNVLNHYQTTKDIEQQQIDYEKELQFYKHNPSLTITDVDVDVAFYPSQLKVKIDGYYKLVNQNNEAISKFLVSLPSDEQNIKLDIKRPYQVQKNTHLRVIEIKLAEPIRSGEQLELTFVISHEKKGFKNADYDISLLQNGSYFHGSQLLPYIGYNSAFEISNKKERESNQLPKREQLSKLIEGKNYHKHGHENDADWINYQATVSTEQGQTPIASGILQKQWTKNGRNYAHYKVDHKISNFLGFASAAYKSKSIKVEEIKLNAFFHSGHSVNVEIMLTTVKNSLTYFQQAFGPYPLPELNLVEIPHRGFGRAYAGTIFISEHVGFFEDLSPNSGIDNFSYLLAHEVAHQWWGHQLAAAKTEGEVLLIESLADYSALMVMKDLYGEQYVNEVIAKSTNQYFKARSADTLGETPLHKMLGQRYLRYYKGPVVLNAIRHLIGEDALNTSLKQLLQAKGNVKSDYATSLDLIGLLKRNSHYSNHALIDEWLTEIVSYDLSIKEASFTKANNGHYQVVASLVGDKLSHTIPGDDKQAFEHQVELAVYSASEKQIASSLQKVLLENGKAQVKFSVPTKPIFLVLDPKYMFLDKSRIDNRISLERAQ